MTNPWLHALSMVSIARDVERGQTGRPDTSTTWCSSMRACPLATGADSSPPPVANKTLAMATINRHHPPEIGDLMDLRKAYADPKPIPARRAKNTIEQLEANPRYAAAAEILRVLKSGMAQVEAEIDVLNIEGHLINRPNDPRARELKNRLSTRRAASG